MSEEKKSGMVTLVGKPNVGKSTLLNYLLGEKLSITSRKPQTTRHRILGIKTMASAQVVFVDTPGIHQREKGQMNRYMNRMAKSALQGVDVVLFVVDCRHFDDNDEIVVKALQSVKQPIIVVLNKIDRLKDRSQLLPLIERLSNEYHFDMILPVSALRREQLDVLEEEIIARLPNSDFLFPEDQLSDRSDRFFISEIIREKLMRMLGDELPYALTVTVELIEDQKKVVKIAATIWVEKSGQKRIVIGKEGRVLKTVGSRARQDIEAMFDKKVFLQLWVKVKDSWSDDEKALAQFGYSN